MRFPVLSNDDVACAKSSASQPHLVQMAFGDRLAPFSQAVLKVALPRSSSFLRLSLGSIRQRPVLNASAKIESIGSVCKQVDFIP